MSDKLDYSKMSEDELKNRIDEAAASLKLSMMAMCVQNVFSEIEQFFENLEADSEFDLWAAVEEIKAGLLDQNEQFVDFLRFLWNHAEAGSEIGGDGVPFKLLEQAGIFNSDFDERESFDEFLWRMSHAAKQDDDLAIADFIILSYLGYVQDRSAIEPS